MRFLDVALLRLCAPAPLRSPQARGIQRKEAKTLRRSAARPQPKLRDRRACLVPTNAPIAALRTRCCAALGDAKQPTKAQERISPQPEGSASNRQ